MSSLAVGRGLDDMELWLGGLFTAAELAAADLLLQLSVAEGINDGEVAASTSTTPSSSPRWGSSCSEGLTVDEKEEEEEEEEEERVFEEPALPLGSLELDRRARKRYRLISELYAATCPVASADAKRRKTCDDASEE